MNKKGQLFLWAVVVSLITWGASRLDAAEHPGTTHAKEHAGKEHAGTATSVQAAPVKEHASETHEHAGKSVEPTKEEIREAMKSYALEMTGQHKGFFPIHDDRTGQNRKLTFQRVHERVGKLSTRDGYFSCADFVDQESGEPLDVDFWVTMKDGVLQVTDSEIHKVNNQARFTYNEKDEKVILN